jgi:hypothetical protein
MIPLFSERSRTGGEALTRIIHDGSSPFDLLRVRLD